MMLQWLRQALEPARGGEPVAEVGKKLEVVRAAAQYEFPVGDIDGMLEEIERGYRSGAQGSFSD